MNVKDNYKKYTAPTYAKVDTVLLGGGNGELYAEDSVNFIDFGSGIAVNSLGCNNEEWVNAVCDQVKKAVHFSNYYYNQPTAILSETLVKRSGLGKVFFSNSGAEANECAIKCARKYSFDRYGEGRYEIVTLKNSFHGRTIATLSATGQDAMHTYFMPFTEGFLYAEPNDFDDFKNKVTKKTCAFMLELIQGEGGVNVMDKAYVKNVYEYCKANDILLIIDEIQTGVGRTGKLFCYQHYGILPDIVSLAKGLAGGIPIGATLFGEKVQDVLTAGTHGTTFGGNPLAAAGANAVLAQIDDKLMDEVIKKSDYIKSELKDCKNIKSISGMGFMLGIETDNYADVMKKCFDRGLLVLSAKTKIRLLPPLTISYETLSEGLKILKEVIG